MFSSLIVHAESNPNSINNVKDNMLRIGFDQQLISDLPDSEILKYKDAKLVSRSEEYYKVDSTVEVDKNTLEEKVISTVKTKISEQEALKNAKEENAKSIQRKADSLMRNNSLVSTYGFGDGYNSNQTYVVSATLKLEVWATYVSGNTYSLSSRFEWLSYPAENNVEDLFAISNDTKATKIQNTYYFIAKYDQYLMDIYGGSTLLSSNVTIDETTAPFKEEITGTGFKYTVPSKVTPKSSQDWYEKKALRGYMSYSLFVPSTSGLSYGVLGSYGHESSYVSIPAPSVSVSFPAGISIQPNYPSIASKVTTASVYANFYVN